MTGVGSTGLNDIKALVFGRGNWGSFTSNEFNPFTDPILDVDLNQVTCPIVGTNGHREAMYGFCKDTGNSLASINGAYCS